MQGQFIFLNSNAYTKDNQYRCYASFADTSGKILSFNASAFQGNLPEPFAVCNVDFEVNQFGNGSTSFILSKLDVTGKLIVDKKG